MKSGIIRAVYVLLVFLLIASYLFFLVYSLNIGRRLKEVNDADRLGEYYKIIPLPVKISDGHALGIEEMSKGYARWGGAPMRDLIYALNQSPSIYAISIYEAKLSLGVWAEDMKTQPVIEQTWWGGGNGTYYSSNWGMYYNDITRVNSGKQRDIGMFALQITSDLPEQSSFTFLEGSGFEEDILYSEYIGTGKPLPVVIGYGLRDLFSVGDICRVDYSKFTPLPDWVTDDNEYYRNHDRYYPDGDMRIEIKGILTQDSTMMSPSGHLMNFYPTTAIILPRFDVYNTPRTEYSNEIDRLAYDRFAGDLQTTWFLTRDDPDEAHAEFMRIVKEAGFEDLVSDTTINVDYHVKGRSLVDYNRTSLGIFIVCTLLLAAVSVVSVIRTVDRNLKIYTLHYLVGATRKRLFIKTVIDHTVSAFIAAGAVYCFAVLIRTRVEGTIHRVILENSFILTTLLLAAAVYTVFVWTVAFFKIRRTDFSRILKEGL